MNIMKGNLIELAKEGKFDVIIHGCNCFCAMGAGIAKAIKAEFPEAYEADCRTIKGDRAKLGDITYAHSEKGGHQLTVVNGYTQYNFRGRKPLVDYDAVRSVFSKVRELFSGKRIAYPKIGAGLAGGDWDIIEKIINEELHNEDHTLVVFSPS
ncbi:MAG: macro domain-containing protein [bacterium]